jgi:hypothetical protein
MFEQTFVEGSAKTNKSWTVMLSFACRSADDHRGDHHPVAQSGTAAQDGAQHHAGRASAPPPPPPPPPPAAQVVKIQKVIPRQFDGSKLMAPKQVPEGDRHDQGG